MTHEYFVIFFFFSSMKISLNENGKVSPGSFHRGGMEELPGIHAYSKSFPYKSHALLIIPKSVLNRVVFVIVILNIFEK